MITFNIDSFKIITKMITSNDEKIDRMITLKNVNKN